MIALHFSGMFIGLWGFLAIASIVTAAPGIIRAYKGIEEKKEDCGDDCQCNKQTVESYIKKSYYQL